MGNKYGRNEGKKIRILHNKLWDFPLNFQWVLTLLHKKKGQMHTQGWHYKNRFIYACRATGHVHCKQAKYKLHFTPIAGCWTTLLVAHIIAIIMEFSFKLRDFASVVFYRSLYFYSRHLLLANIYWDTIKNMNRPVSEYISNSLIRINVNETHTSHYRNLKRRRHVSTFIKFCQKTQR
jgi:hypothetical protein